MNLSIREKLLVFGSLVLFILYIYFNFALEPLLRSINKDKISIAKTRELINQKKSSNIRSNSYNTSTAILLPKENQATYIVFFINEHTKKYELKLMSLSQSSGNRKIIVDLGLQGKYENIISFLNSLKESNSFLYVESADISSQKNGIALSAKIVCAYK